MSRYAPVFDAAKIARLRHLTDRYGIEQAAAMVGTSANAIRRIRRRGWTVAHRGSPLRPMPSDFRIQCDAMSLHQLARHYGAGVTTVCRWASEVGREPMRGGRR